MFGVYRLRLILYLLNLTLVTAQGLTRRLDLAQIQHEQRWKSQLMEEVTKLTETKTQIEASLKILKVTWLQLSEEVSKLTETKTQITSDLAKIQHEQRRNAWLQGKISELTEALNSARAALPTHEVIGVDGLPDSVISSVGMNRNKRHRQAGESQSSLAIMQQQQDAHQQTLKRVKAEVVEAKTSASEAQLETEDAKDRHLCIICSDNVISCMYSPCKHIVTCDDCDMELARHKNTQPCPKCQTPIASRVRGVYLP